MTCFQDEISIETRPRALHDISAEVAQVVRQSGVRCGLCTVFMRHTSASLTIQENADPAVQRDLARWMAEVAPEGRRWEHGAEGADDMPAHARAALTSTSESIPVTDGRLALGTWQGLYVWEHRAHPHRRRVLVHVAGDE
ncbi:MAG: YjbQ family protein [Deltaproteobacteria bacterium]|nr:YjbQ family protein [Deltaproteobacteria bacterium]